MDISSLKMLASGALSTPHKRINISFDIPHTLPSQIIIAGSNERKKLVLSIFKASRDKNTVLVCLYEKTIEMAKILKKYRTLNVTINGHSIKTAYAKKARAKLHKKTI